MKGPAAFILSLTLLASGCAAARAQAPRLQTAPLATDSRELMAAYIRELPAGSRVRVSLASGAVVHGILMKGDADPIVIQKRTRLPEPPLLIPIDQVLALEPEGKNGGTARSIALGAAAGAAASLGVLMIIAAIVAGS